MENSVENETLEEFKLQIDRDSAVSKGEPTKKEIAISELKEIEKDIEECKEKIMSIIKLQAFCRGRIARKRYNKTQSDLLTKEQNEKNSYFVYKEKKETITKSIFDFSAPREKRPKYIFKSGVTYEGEWKGGFRDGFGTQIWPDGACYTGDWSFNYAHGKGKFIHIDGDTYEGEWGYDKANGYGEFQHSNGAHYSGYWRNDFQCGRGIEKWADGSFYDGLYVRGKKDGFGIYLWTDQSKFMGQWKENKICGIGLYTWADGRTYKGEWKDNDMHGYGIYNWVDGMISKHGFGVYYWKDGRRYEGLWSKGKQHGVGRYLVPQEGKNKIGAWKEGARKCWIEGENIEKLIDKYFQGGITLDNDEIMCNEDEGLDFSKVRMYFYDSAQFQKFVESVINKVDNLLKEHSDILSKYDILN